MSLKMAITPFYLPSYEKKALLLSLGIHLALWGIYELYSQNNPIKNRQKEESFMYLSHFELPLEAKKEVKPQELPNFIDKVMPKSMETKPLKKENINPLEPLVKPNQAAYKEVFSKEIIEAKPQIAPVETKDASKENPLFETEEAFVKTNFSIIRDKVLKNLIYPSIARKMKWTGVVEIAIVIDTQGKIIQSYIHKSSSKKQFDIEAQEAVKRIYQDILPIPQTISTIILPISFKLQ